MNTFLFSPHNFFSDLSDDSNKIPEHISLLQLELKPRGCCVRHLLMNLQE